MLIIIRLLAGLVTTIASWFGVISSGILGFISVQFLKWVAIKALVFFVLGVVLPVLLYNIITDIIVSLMDASMEQMTAVLADQSDSLVLSFTGLAGWVANQIYLPQAIAVILSAIAIKFLLGLIPFVRV